MIFNFVQIQIGIIILIYAISLDTCSQVTCMRGANLSSTFNLKVEVQHLITITKEAAINRKQTWTNIFPRGKLIPTSKLIRILRLRTKSI